MWKGYGRAGAASDPRLRQRALPRLPAGAARAHRGRRLLGLARDDARARGRPDPGERPHELRGRLPRAARRRLHRGRRVPLPRARGGARGGRGRGRGRRSSSSSSTSPTRAAGSSASGRSRSPPTSASSRSCGPTGSASASPPTPSAPVRATGSRSSGRYAAEHELPLHVHADEQPREIEECLAEHGLRPIELLDACGCLGPRTTVVHATHADGHELDLLAAAGARVCACPTTEANLGDGFLPVERLLHRGIGLCIGSDSNVRIDPLEELRELDGIARRQSGRRDVFAVDDLLAIGSASGAKRAGARVVAGGRRRRRASPACGSRGLAERARRRLLGRRASERPLGSGSPLPEEVQWTSSLHAVGRDAGLGRRPRRSARSAPSVTSSWRCATAAAGSTSCR